MAPDFFSSFFYRAWDLLCPQSSKEQTVYTLVDLCEYCLDLITFFASSGEIKKHLLKRPTHPTCQFCQGLLQPMFEDVKDSDNQFFNLSFRRDKDFGRPPNYEWLWCYGYCRCEDTNDSVASLYFAIWSNDGDPACQTLVTRPPVVGPNIDEFCELIGDWSMFCAMTHVECGPVQETELPSRVLRISTNNTEIAVNLMETKSIRTGRFWALSHCWGPVDKQPLRTTRANYHEHLRNIPFGKLPKTFQETIMLTHGTGIEYLWIDSLCILQDDRDDWESEAVKMADVYRNAALVVAASGAKDSTEGLSLTDRRSKIVYKVPYILEGRRQGTFNIALLLEADYPEGPLVGPLNSRAWTLQERILAKRIMFFSKGLIYWKCKAGERNERGPMTVPLFHETIEWMDILDEYSSKRLTNPQDRLYALQGMIAELKQTRQDHYHYEFGVWEDELEHQLLWRRTGTPSNNNSLPLPTWTWAATGFSKIWILRYPKMNNVVQSKKIVVNTTGSLTCAGQLTISRLTLRPCADTTGCSSVHPYYTRLASELFMVPGMGYLFSTYPAYMVLDPRRHASALGICVFDDEPSESVQCFVMLSNEREDDPYRILKDDDEPTFLDPELRQVALQSKFVYWCLLLEPVEEGKYKRVGLAMLYPHALEALNVEYADFEII